MRPKHFAFASALKTNMPSFQHSLEERRADYFAARNRIFSVDSGDVNEPVKQKPRNVPMVARRMIAHALGHRINPNNQVATIRDCKKHCGQTDALETSQQTIFSSHQNMNFYGRVKSNDKNSSGLSLSKSNTPQKLNDKISPHVSISQNGSSGNGVDKDYLKKEHLGAAKRMFANALGLQSGKDGFISKGNNVKYANTEWGLKNLKQQLILCFVSVAISTLTLELSRLSLTAIESLMSTYMLEPLLHLLSGYAWKKSEPEVVQWFTLWMLINFYSP